MHPSAVVFDLDGTLVDTAPDLHRVLAVLMDELDRPPPTLDNVRAMVGEGARVLLERALDASGGAPPDVEIGALVARFIEVYSADPVRHSVPYEGVLAELERLAALRVPLGVCTNKPQLPTDRVLAALDLERYFAAAIGGDALAVRKPDPEHLAAVLRGLGVGSNRAVLVGDSRTDLLTAQALGIPCVLVGFGYSTMPVRELGADEVIDSFEELPAALARVLGAT